MDIFSTTAMNESLGHAITQNAQPGYRYGHIIDECKDPRRRKQERDAEDRNVLPVRSGTSVIKGHDISGGALQGNLSTSDLPGKGTLLVKTAEPTIRSGNIGRKTTEPEQRVGETIPAGDDALSSESGIATAARERDRTSSIQPHNHLPQATPSEPKKPRLRRPPLWSVSSRRYQELFLKAQSSGPVQNRKAKQLISYDTEKVVLAASLQAPTLLEGEGYKHQEGFVVLRSTDEILITNPTSNFIDSNPPKPKRPRSSMQLVDTVSRLLEDSKGGVEYVKGVGVLRLEADEASTEQRPAPRLDHNPQIENETTIDSKEERSFVIQHIMTEDTDLSDVEIRWTARNNTFVWHKDRQILEEPQALPAQSIEAVWYHSEGQGFHLCPRARNAPGLQRPFKELLFVMTGPSLEFMMLKSVFETSIGAMKVNWVDRTHFVEKARELQHIRELQRPTVSMTVPPVVVFESSILEDRVHRAEGLPEPPKEDLYAAADDAAESEPDVETQDVLEKVSNIGNPSEVEIASELGTQEIASTSDAAAGASLPPKLLYISGEMVTLGDLVIRLRCEDETKNEMNSFDGLDVYDGPWVVSELPLSSATMASDLFEDDVDLIDTVNPTTQLDEKVSSEDEDKLMDKVRQKLIKLEFPLTSKAEPWTELGRLRPVYGVSAGAASTDAKTVYQQLQESNGGSIINVDTTDIDFNSDDPTGVVRIKKGAYGFVQYVSFEPTDEDTFEVEKLRGKNLWRYSMEDCGDHVTDCTDPLILRYLGHECGYVGEDEVLTLKYLVHWAGWPSEDDSWEFGYNNIPQHLKEEYATNMGDFEEGGLQVTKAMVDMTRKRSAKRRKKKAKVASVKSRKRKSAVEDGIDINSDSEEGGQKAVIKSKRRASVRMVKAIQRHETD